VRTMRPAASSSMNPMRSAGSSGSSGT
jgi:hypothetical protein